MKFCFKFYFDLHKIEEWKEKYLDYYENKRILKNIEKINLKLKKKKYKLNKIMIKPGEQEAVKIEIEQLSTTIMY
jgi:hypothetical protein